MNKLGEIGAFEIVERIDESGFSSLYRGVDKLDGGPVRVLLCMSRDKELQARFREAVETAARLDHQNVLATLDLGTLAGRPYVVYEHSSDLCLADLLRDAPTRDPEELPPLRRLDLLIQVAEALQAAHAKGVLHGDLKPEVILVKDRRTVKVGEFGTAKLSAAARLLKHPGMEPSHAGYPTPEQALGLPADSRTDVFCFGALAYEVLGGAKPFVGETWAEGLQHVLQSRPRPISELWPGCPPALEGLISKCLAKEPAERYLGPGKLINDLIAGFGQLASKQRLEAVSDVLPRPPLTPDDPDRRWVTRVISVDEMLRMKRKAAADEEAGAKQAPGLETLELPDPDDPEATAEFSPPLAPARSPAPASAPVPDLEGDRRRGWVAGAAVVIVILLAAIWGLGPSSEAPPVADPAHGDSSPAPLPAVAAATGIAVLEALPWAEVSRIVAESDEEMALPDNRATPLVLNLAEGSYEIELRRPASGDEEPPETRTCRVEISSTADSVCKVDFDPADVTQYFKESGWWQ